MDVFFYFEVIARRACTSWHGIKWCRVFSFDKGLRVNQKDESHNLCCVGFSFLFTCVTQITFWKYADKIIRCVKQESPPIDGAVRNATSLIPEQLSSIILVIACSYTVYARPCIYSSALLIIFADPRRMNGYRLSGPRATELTNWPEVRIAISLWMCHAGKQYYT